MRPKSPTIDSSVLKVLDLISSPCVWRPATPAELRDEYLLEYEDVQELRICDKSETFLLVRFVVVGDPGEGDQLQIDAHWWDVPEDGGGGHQISLTIEEWGPDPEKFDLLRPPMQNIPTPSTELSRSIRAGFRRPMIVDVDYSGFELKMAAIYEAEMRRKR